MGSHRSRSAVLALLVALTAACGTREAPSPPPVLAIELAGCAQTPRAGVCELTDEAREVTVFVPSTDVRASIDGAELAPREQVDVQDGLRLRLEVPAGARVLELRAGDARATVRIEPSAVPPRVGRLLEMRRRGELDALERELDAWDAELEQSGAPPEQVRCDRARATGVRARLAFTRGDAERVSALYAASIPALLACGRLSEALDDARAHAHTLIFQRRDFATARATLEDAARRGTASAEAGAWIAYQRASLAMRVGDLGEAMRHLEDAERRGERLGLARLRAGVLQLRSWLYGVLGRHDDAERSIEAAQRSWVSESPCDRAMILTNLGWQRLARTDAGERSPSAAREPLEAALALTDSTCVDPVRRSQVRLNLARVAVQEGAFAEAERVLREVADAAPSADGAIAIELLDVRGRLHLDAGDARAALAVYDELSARLRAAGESLPTGALGRARALLALGRTDDAIEALAASEDELDRQVASLSLGMGRESLSLGRGESARLLVQSLLARGRVEDAFFAARRARARVLWSLPRTAAMLTELPPEERRSRERAIGEYWALRERMDALARQAFTLPADELPAAERAQAALRAGLAAHLEQLFPASHRQPRALAPAPGELVLGVFPLGDRTFVFAQDAAGVHGAEHPEGAPPELVLESQADALRAARSLRVIAPTEGPLARIHALRVGGSTPLGLSVPVEYALDVPHATRVEPRPDARDLFVLDPRGDLPGARREAVWLREHLPDAGSHAWLLGRDATRDAVLDAFGRARSMHYAGHATHTTGSWWESGLLLGQGTVLTVSDVLAAHAVPRDVVLAACDTARSSPARHVATIGIAQAFVLAGSAHAVATLDAVEDPVALTFSRAYHATGSGDPRQRMQLAVRALHAARQPWSTFVLLTP